MRYELLRVLRKEKGFTLAEMGEKTGYTPSFLSQLERGLKQPSLDAMRRIADCLDISVISLLDDQTEAAGGGVAQDAHCSIIRNGNRRKFRLEENGAEYEMITPQTSDDFRKYAMYGMLVSIAPGAWSNTKPVSHFYDECCYIVSGKMRAVVGEEIYELEDGDSFYIEGFIPHNYLNTGDEPLIVIGFQSK